MQNNDNFKASQQKEFLSFEQSTSPARRSNLRNIEQEHNTLRKKLAELTKENNSLDRSTAVADAKTQDKSADKMNPTLRFDGAVVKSKEEIMLLRLVEEYKSTNKQLLAQLESERNAVLSTKSRIQSLELEVKLCNNQNKRLTQTLQEQIQKQQNTETSSKSNKEENTKLLTDHSSSDAHNHHHGLVGQSSPREREIALLKATVNELRRAQQNDAYVQKRKYDGKAEECGELQRENEELKQRIQELQGNRENSRINERTMNRDLAEDLLAAKEATIKELRIQLKEVQDKLINKNHPSSKYEQIEDQVDASERVMSLPCEEECNGKESITQSQDQQPTQHEGQRRKSVSSQTGQHSKQEQSSQSVLKAAQSPLCLTPFSQKQQNSQHQQQGPQEQPQLQQSSTQLSPIDRIKGANRTQGQQQLQGDEDYLLLKQARANQTNPPPLSVALLQPSQIAMTQSGYASFNKQQTVSNEEHCCENGDTNLFQTLSSPESAQEQTNYYQNDAVNTHKDQQSEQCYYETQQNQCNNTNSSEEKKMTLNPNEQFITSQEHSDNAGVETFKSNNLKSKEDAIKGEINRDQPAKVKSHQQNSQQINIGNRSRSFSLQPPQQIILSNQQQRQITYAGQNGFIGQSALLNTSSAQLSNQQEQYDQEPISRVILQQDSVQTGCSNARPSSQSYHYRSSSSGPVQQQQQQFNNYLSINGGNNVTPNQSVGFSSAGMQHPYPLFQTQGGFIAIPNQQYISRSCFSSNLNASYSYNNPNDSSYNININTNTPHNWNNSLNNSNNHPAAQIDSVEMDCINSNDASTFYTTTPEQQQQIYLMNQQPLRIPMENNFYSTTPQSFVSKAAQENPIIGSNLNPKQQQHQRKGSIPRVVLQEQNSNIPMTYYGISSTDKCLFSDSIRKDVSYSQNQSRRTFSNTYQNDSNQLLFDTMIPSTNTISTTSKAKELQTAIRIAIAPSVSRQSQEQSQQQHQILSQPRNGLQTEQQNGVRLLQLEDNTTTTTILGMATQSNQRKSIGRRNRIFDGFEESNNNATIPTTLNRNQLLFRRSLADDGGFKKNRIFFDSTAAATTTNQKQGQFDRRSSFSRTNQLSMSYDVPKQEQPTIYSGVSRQLNSQKGINICSSMSSKKPSTYTEYSGISANNLSSQADHLSSNSFNF